MSLGALALNRKSSPVESEGISGSAQARGPFQLVSIETVLDAILRSKTITVMAYSLQPNALIVHDLELAADRGAEVSVGLSRGFGMYVTENESTASELGLHGVRVHILESTTRATHIKAVVLDGDLYLSDRNWADNSAEQAVIHDAVPGDRTLIERAILGQPDGNDHLWTRKYDALAAEARLLAQSSSGDVRVSSESFSASSPIFEELRRRAQRGDNVHLIVAESEYSQRRSERNAAALLSTAGVKIRILNSDEKLAVVGPQVWIGSANATGGDPNQIDFGLVLSDKPIADELSAQFDGEWSKARSIYRQ